MQEVKSGAAGALEESVNAARARAQAFCGRLGIDRPFLSAPMEGVAGVDLVAAVSEAGGLGVLPAGEMTPGEIAAAAAAVRAKTKKPFAVQIRIPPKGGRSPDELHQLADGLSSVFEDLGLPAPLSKEGRERYDFTLERAAARFEAQFAAVLAARPAVVLSTSGGLREPEAEALFDARIVNIGTATTLREAKVLRAAKVDAVVLQGSEAGGPRANFEDRDDVMMGLNALVPAAAKATRLPVVAAGGVCGPEQALGLVLAGASAVMCGTALTGTAESLASAYAKRALVWADAAALTTTRLYTGRLVRCLRSPLLDALADYEAVLPAWPLPEVLMHPLTEAARRAGREELEAVFLGQSVGRSAYRTAAEAVGRITALIA